MISKEECHQLNKGISLRPGSVFRRYTGHKQRAKSHGKEGIPKNCGESRGEAYQDV